MSKKKATFYQLLFKTVLMGLRGGAWLDGWLHISNFVMRSKSFMWLPGLFLFVVLFFFS
jgi:hypothetical protein